MQPIYVILLTFLCCGIFSVIVYQLFKILEECEKNRLRKIKVYPIRNYRQNRQEYIPEQKTNKHILVMRNCPD